MTYKVLVEIPQIFDVEAASPEQAIQNVMDGLVSTNQIKAADVINISIVDVIDIDDLKKGEKNENN